MVKTYQDLIVWQKAHAMVLRVYRLTPSLPSHERFGLTSQLQRSSASVAANIVEGFSQGTKKGFLNFLHHSRGSLEETKYHLLLAKDLQYISVTDHDQLIEQCDEVGRLLYGLMDAVRNQVENG